MQSHNAFQFICQMSAPFRFAFGEGLLAAVIGVGQMINARQHGAEDFAVGDNPADRNAAKANPVIAAFAANQTGALALTLRIPISKGNLQCGINGFGTGIDKKHMVEIARCQISNPAGQFEAAIVSELERGRKIKLGRLFLDGGDNRLTRMSRIAAPQACRGVEDFFTIRGCVMHVLGTDHHARAFFEGAVGGKGHPPGFKVIRRIQGMNGLGSGGTHGMSPRIRCKGSNYQNRITLFRA